MPDVDTSSATSATTPLLDYAEPPGWHRRPRVRRYAVVFAVIAMAAIGFWRWGPGLWRQTLYLRAQARCMNYAPPADQVVYEEDPERVETLRARQSPSYRRVVYRGTFEGTDWDPVALNTPVMDGFMSITLLQVNPPLLFLHERRDPAGHRYLVWIGLQIENAEERGQGRVVSVVACVFRPARLWSYLEPVKRDDYLSLHDVQASDTLRVFAGQFDANDASRFSIRYELNGTAGVIEGQLLDGGQLKLESPGWVTETR
jgi:hypothetical protein